MTNRLAAENSPYLLQHADNPVDWYPWGVEAFRRARDSNVPIFLSIGYAACHWCHVMAHESFEDPHVAAFMNEHFISIKVDREERPDVDAVYMEAVVALTGQGGWPMSVFLTPQGEPFFGGTYFPPERRHNMPSFLELLIEIDRLWQEEHARLLSIGGQLASHLKQALPADDPNGALEPEQLNQAARTLFDQYDWRHGGWSAAPKFPQSAAIEFLLRTHRRHGGSLALDMARHALDSMASGGIFDQLGGGFHRYAVDAAWLVPHFEKMLYDNACLMQVYLHAWQLTRNERYLEVVENTYEFLQAELRDPAGGYYASIDADSEGGEGLFYTWTPAEVTQVLQDAELSEIANETFGITQEGNFEGRNVLSVQETFESAAHAHDVSLVVFKKQLSSIRDRLCEARSMRPKPPVDDKVLAAWNGLLLQTLSEAACATRREDMLESCRSLAEFMLREMIVDGELRRSWRQGQTTVSAFLEDHAAVGLGMLALYQVDFDPRWLKQARHQANVILDRFIDPAGGFFDTSNDQENLIARPKSIQDSPYPSGSSMAVGLLLRLHALTAETRFHVSAIDALRRHAARAVNHPTAFAGWLNNIDFELGTQIQLGLVGDPASEQFQRLFAAVTGGYYPRMVRAGGPPDLEELPALLEGRGLLDGRPTAYLCQDFRCLLPTNDAQVLAAQLVDATKPAGE
jgi:uncharacterized protein YyaL (SSP411 family)